MTPVAAPVPEAQPPAGGVRLSRRVWAVGIGLVVALAAAASVAVVLLREREIENWRSRLDSTSLVLAEQTVQTLFSAYLVLDEVAQEVRRAGATDAASLREAGSTRRLHDMLRSRIQGLPQIDVASIVADNGDNLNFSRSYPVPPINLADRDYFQVHLRNPRAGDYISTAVRNRGTGKWTFYLSRRLDDASGHFMGMVLVGLSVNGFNGFYERLTQELGPGSTVALYRNDLRLLARSPHRDDLMGRVNSAGATQAARDFARQLGTDHAVVLTEAPRFSDGSPIPRMAAMRHTRQYDLIVSVIVEERVFLQGWRQAAAWIAGLTAAACVLLLVGVGALVRTLRQREAAEADLRVAKEAAETANQAKSRFLANMSHEIRTPLNGVLGLAQVLQAESMDDRTRRQQASLIQRTGESLLAILNDVLDLSKVEAGRLEIAHLPFRPDLLVRDIVQLFEPSAHARGLRIAGRWLGPQGQVVLGDPARLRQMLTNLVGNAVKFTPSGFVDVEAAPDGAGWLRVSVRDSGVGIEPAQQDALFQPFRQLDASNTRAHGGTGLGLSIVSSLARLMGGAVGVESTPQAGSHFWFRVPAPDAPPQAGPPEPLSEPRGPASAPPVQVPQAATDAPDAVPPFSRFPPVLVVEDDPVNVIVIRSLLARLGCACEVVTDGEQAVRRLREAPLPSLVLMDCQMPVLDGLEATRRYRAWERESASPRLPIVAFTAGAFQDDMSVCLEAGMDDVLTKPVHLTRLRECVARWLKAPLETGSA